VQVAVVDDDPNVALPRLLLVVVRSLDRCQSCENLRNTFTLVPCMDECRLSATTFSTCNIGRHPVKAVLWIRIRIGSGFSDFVDPDPYWESGSRGKKVKKFSVEKCTLVPVFKKKCYH
jgi:hypothetical protein